MTPGLLAILLWLARPHAQRFAIVRKGNPTELQSLTWTDWATARTLEWNAEAPGSRSIYLTDAGWDALLNYHLHGTAFPFIEYGANI